MKPTTILIYTLAGLLLCAASAAHEAQEAQQHAAPTQPAVPAPLAARAAEPPLPRLRPFSLKPPAKTPGAVPQTPGATSTGAARIDALAAQVQARLASPAAMRVFRQYNAAHGRQIQHHLADIYGTNPQFIRDAGGPGRPLGDSIVGPVTLKWLGQFCGEYGIVATDPNFEHEVVESLEQVAEIAKAHPDWQAILFSPEFEAWVDAQPTPDRVRSSKIRRSGAAPQVNALIEQYLKERQGAPVSTVRPLPLEVTFSYDPKRPAAVRNLAAVAERLKPMATLDPADEELFDEDVKLHLAGIALDEETLALIRRFSQRDAYVVRPELLVKLRKDGMPEPAVEVLGAQMGGIAFDSVQAFDDALAEVIGGSADGAALAAGKREILREARLPRFRVPETLAADLAGDSILAPAVAALFGGIANVEYPTEELFDAALQWQVWRALGMCRDPVRGAPGAIGDKELEALAVLLPEVSASRNKFGELRAVTQGCSPEQLAEADALAYRTWQHVAPRLRSKMDLREHHVVRPEQRRDSDWAIDHCTCGRDDRDGMVYGFYPLWTVAGERQIDFGHLSRIGLYGLTTDDTGKLRVPQGMRPDREGRFIPDSLAGMLREAHQHRVRVDWVVARSDWQTWRQLKRDRKIAVLEALATNIVAMLDQPLQNGGQMLTRIASLGLDRGPTSGDGVALYFRDFPVADKDLFNKFVIDLSARLGVMRHARRLSLMVDQDDFGKAGPFEHANLTHLLETMNPVKGLSFADSKPKMLSDMPVLVMVTEPTHDSKMQLRGGVQQALHGADSQRLMRVIIPVLEYDGRSSQQLGDDIIYISDNYYGIGFWPLPFATAQDDVGDTADKTTSVNRLLTLFYQPDDFPPTRWERYIAYLCPERLWLRWVAWITLAVAVGVAIYYARCRGCNERLDNSPLYFSAMVGLMALPLLAVLVLVLSDPVLDPFASVVFFLYGTGGLVVAALVARYYWNKSRRKVP